MKKVIASIAIIFVLFSGLFPAPVPFAYAQQNDVGANAGAGTSVLSTPNQQASVEQELSGCNILNNFSLCVLWLIYHVFLGLSFWCAEITGKLFDFFISYTLNSEAYLAPFIEKGWGVIRDLANVLFIFTLLFLAIRHILGLKAKEYIPVLIIVALLLNFSLFFTKVAIDAGNILARTFYNSIVINNDTYADEIGFKSISVGLLDKINPQKLLTESLFEPKFVTQTGDYSTQSGGFQNPAEGTSAYLRQNINNNFGYYALVFILLGVVNFTLAWVFLSVALLFLARTIGLWFAMIFSPIAFVTLAVPGSGGMLKGLSFNSWKDNVLKLSFLAPIFLFFLYLTIMFLTVIFATPIPVDGRDTAMRILEVFIPFIFVIMILRKSKDVANDLAGDMGGMIKGLVGKAVGAIGGMALGGAAFAGRAVVGRLASSALQGANYKERIKNAKGLNKWRLIQQRAALKNLKSSSFDIRNAPKAKGFAGAASGFIGGQLNTAARAFGGDKMTFGKGSGESRKKYEDDREKQQLELAKDLASIDPGEVWASVQRDINEFGVKDKGKILQRFDKLLMMTRQSNYLSQKDKNKKIGEMNALRESIEAAQTDDHLQKAIKEGKLAIPDKDKEGKVKVDNKGNVVYKLENTEFGGTKGIVKDRRSEQARHVQYDDVWYNMTTGNNNVTADKIRSPEDSKEKKVAKLLKEIDGDDKPPKTEEEPKPETPPPGGGGQTP